MTKKDTPKVKDKTKAPKKTFVQEDQQADSRFARVYKDPSFMVAPTKDKKVAIDSRFKGMFTDKQFNVVAKVDKYGKKINKKDEYALQNYYQKDSESGSDGSDKSDDQSSGEEQQKNKKKVEQSEGSEDDLGKKYYDSDGKFDW